MKFALPILAVSLAIGGCLAMPHLDHRSPQVSGRVVEAESQEPVADARVEFADNPALAALTDANGTFVIHATRKPELLVPLNDTDAYDIGQNIRPLLRISRDGFEDEEIDAGKIEYLDWVGQETGSAPPHPVRGPFRVAISLRRISNNR